MKQNKQDTLSFKGNRDTWLDFTHKIKKDKKQVWEVLGPILKEYMKK